MNRVDVVGRLTKKPYVGYGKDGKCYATYTVVAENGQYPDLVPILCFGKPAETARDYFDKGMRVEVIGKIYTSKDKSGVWRTKVYVFINRYLDRPDMNRDDEHKNPFEYSRASDEIKKEFEETGNYPSEVFDPNEIDEEDFEENFE